MVIYQYRQNKTSRLVFLKHISPLHSLVMGCTPYLIFCVLSQVVFFFFLSQIMIQNKLFSSGLVRLEIIFSMLLEVKEILEICKCLGGKKIKGNLNEVETKPLTYIYIVCTFWPYNLISEPFWLSNPFMYVLVSFIFSSCHSPLYNLHCMLHVSLHI